MMVYSMLALKGEGIRRYKFMKTLKSGKAVSPDDISGLTGVVEPLNCSPLVRKHCKKNVPPQTPFQFRHTKTCLFLFPCVVQASV